MIEGQQWDSKEKLPPVPIICGSCSKEKSNSKDTTASALTHLHMPYVDHPSLVPSPPQLSSLSSDDSCGGGLGTRLGSPPVWLCS